VDEEGSVTKDILDWITVATDAEDVRIERRSAGGSRAGFAVDVRHRDGSEDALWLRIDAGHGPLSPNYSEFTLQKEAIVYQALQKTAVRVPEFIAVHPTQEAFLMRRVEGRNWFSELKDPSQAEAVASDFMHQLVALHNVDPLSLELPGFGTPRDVSTHIKEEIDLWERLYLAGAGEREPIVLMSIAWLRKNLPDNGQYPTVFVQGDTGPGNFMFNSERVVAVVDWENAHFGDFHDDLGWMYARDLQERFTYMPDRMEEYQLLSGRKIDLVRLRYFIVLAQLRCAIGTLNAIGARQGEIANHFIYGALHLRMLAEALAEATAISWKDEEIAASPSGATENTWLYDVVLQDLKEVIVPGLASNGFASRRGKGIARIIKILREEDRLGRDFERAEVEDLSSALQLEIESAKEGRRRLCDAVSMGTLDETVGIKYSLRHVNRRTALLRSAMGELADRHYAPVQIGR
jgi:aminoglycoside phosphotransferase (APT) family kinase protein